MFTTNLFSPDNEDIRKYLYAGEVFTNRDPHIVTTVLGSCISVCLWDKRLKICGINHFMTPTWDRRKAKSAKYGDIAMRTLMNEMGKLGSKKVSLVAMVYGGGEVLPTENMITNVGEKNIEFALKTLNEIGIRIIDRCVGGKHGRRLVFDTHDGSVKLSKVQSVLGKAKAIIGKKPANAHRKLLGNMSNKLTDIKNILTDFAESQNK